MNDNDPMTHDADKNHGRFWYLIDAAISGNLADAELQELETLLLSDHHLRQQYLEYAKLHYELEFLHFAQQAVEAVRSQGSGVGSQGSGVGSQGSGVGSQESGVRGRESGIRGQGSETRRAGGRVLALALVLLVLVGVAGYVIWERKGREEPSVVHAPEAIVATLVHRSDAQWVPDHSPAGNELHSGQRLKLSSGVVEIVFASQAKVILEGPADFIVGGKEKIEPKSEIRNHQSEISNSCYLASGALTARVPEAAQGFTVRTPTGTATDLGTEFGVYVKSEVGSRRSDSESPTSYLRGPTSTEVHVFEGRVAVSDGELSKSQIRNPKSQIVSAGEAVAMASTGLERLPAADPFRFRTEAFEGGARQVLVTEDFESMHVGDSGRTIGPWRTEYAAGRHQHIVVVDPTASGMGASSPPVLPPLGGRAMEFANTAKETGKQGRQLNAMLWRELDGKQLPARCKLLLQCDISPRTTMVEPSLSLTHDYPLRLAPGFALSEAADPAAAKIEWKSGQWYRLRVVWDVENGSPRGATVERLQWRGADGWVRDASVLLPSPKLPSDPLAQLRFGFPAPITGKAGGTYWLDNVRVEVLEEK